ncbi:MAG TPA: thiolase family protein [Kofleriaceae bacterium]|nr:thiolase family protein [Kofleriaceae bacterium]
MTRVAIVDSVRTGISRAFQGRLRAARPDDMAAHCVDALLARNPWLSRARVDDCVIGCAFPEGPQGMNLGRNVAVLSRLGRDTAGLTISRYCASGLDAVAHAAARIASGQAEVVIAGGVESISMTLKSVNAHELFNPAIRDRSPGTYVKMGWDNPAIPFWKRAFRTMGETAEIIAEQHGISRAAQDGRAWQSQRRTARAQDAGVFRDEIVPLPVVFDDPVTGAAVHEIVDRDDCSRPDTTLEVLATLPPAFRPDGSVTAGNAAPAADGAACMVLVSEDLARREGLAVNGRFTGYATVGCEPERMADGAVRAIRKLCAAHRLAPGDIDVYEINEVFAAQLLHCVRVLELDDERVNVHGGALGLGHPFGMTGARLVGHAARELVRRGRRRAVVAMCVGGGIGAAALIEVPAT